MSSSVNTPKRVVGLQFGVLSPNEIKSMSHVEITKGEGYESGRFVTGGLYDPRMGVITSHDECATCRLSGDDCPGHFGYLRLAKPVYNIEFIGYVKNILETICIKCGEFLIPPSLSNAIRKIKAKNRLKILIELSKKVSRCPDCGSSIPTLKIREVDKIFYTFKDTGEGTEVSKGETELPAEYALHLFERFTDRQIELFGLDPSYAKPAWLIITILPIAPPSMRPSVKTEEHSKHEDDLYVFYNHIIKYNNDLLKKVSALQGMDITTIQNPLKIIGDYVKAVSYMIASMHNDKIKKVQGRPTYNATNKPLKSIKDRITGKGGRWRRNILGKRVNQSARSVISPDYCLAIDELGVPLMVAKTLTFTEHVTERNIDALYQMIRTNHVYSYTHDKIRKILKFEKAENLDKIRIVPGDRVERHLVDGDFVLFNRQPSLHKHSMMAFKIVVLPEGSNNTFRFNPAACSAFNADFDGDEMNIHLPQSVQTMVEIQELTHVAKMFITPKYSMSLIGVIQDNVFGAYTFTQKESVFTHAKAMYLLADCPFHLLDRTKLQEHRTQKTMKSPDIMSLIIPRDATYVEKVEVRKGHIIKGQFAKSTVGAKSGDFLKTLFNDLGFVSAKDFTYLLQKFTNQWNIVRGVSAGLSDIILPQEVMKKRDEAINASLLQSKKLLADIDSGHFEVPIGKTVQEHYEKKTSGIFNILGDMLADQAKKSMNPDINNIYIMVTAGSKGNNTNIGQMASSVGQVSVSNERIRKSYGKRAFPHYFKFEDDPESRGLVKHSFLEGLSPAEFFCHAAAGREGLIDTGLKTARSGYIARKLEKSLEDVYIAYDYSIRLQSGTVLQFLYSGDAIDTVKLEDIDNDIYTINNQKLMDLTVLGSATLKKATRDLLEEERLSLFKDRELLRAQVSKLKPVDKNVSFKAPFSISRIIAHAIDTVGQGSPLKENDADITFIIESIKDFCQEIPQYFYNDTEEAEKNIPSLIKEMFATATTLSQIIIRRYLTAKSILRTYHYTKAQFILVIQTIRNTYLRAISHPGEMIGSVLAQNIAETTTQLTLNTFHYAGVSEKSEVNSGVPRLGELTEAKEKIQTPYLTIFLTEEYRNKAQGAKEIMNKIEHNNIIAYTSVIEIWYDPEPWTSTKVQEDTRLLADHKKYTMGTEVPASLSKLVLRLEFKRTQMVYRQLRMSQIEAKIKEEYPMLYIISSNDNAEHLIMRIHLIMSKITDRNRNEYDLIYKYKDKILYNITLRGIKNIDNVEISRKPMFYFDDTTGELKKTPEDEYILYTVGTNMAEVFTLEGVDTTRSFSNDIHEIYECLGIEAARRALINEIMMVFASLSTDSVKFKQLSVLADLMTHSGIISSINRSGMKKSENGPLQRSSFEEGLNIFTQAAFNCELDTINGFAGSLMFGQAFHGGTNSFELIWDDTAFLSHEKIIRKGVSRKKITELLE